MRSTASDSTCPISGMTSASRKGVNTSIRHSLRALRSIVLLFGCLSIISSGSALTIRPGDATLYSANSVYDLSQVNGLVGTTGLGELYRKNVGGAEVGSFMNSYTPTFWNTPAEPSDVDLRFVGGGAAAITEFENLWLYIRDTRNPACYLINLNLLEWDGRERLQLRDFWPSVGHGISSISILGANATVTSVPDGGMTLLLLGGSLAALGGFARRAKR